MAIMGVARYIGNILKDTFLSGLWKDQFYRDLLWCSASPDVNSRLTDIDLPSWSWASVRTSISYSRWPAGSSPTYLKSMLTLLSTDLDQGRSNDAICRRLVVGGIVQKVSRGSSQSLYPVKVDSDDMEKAGSSRVVERSLKTHRSFDLDTTEEQSKSRGSLNTKYSRHLPGRPTNEDEERRMSLKTNKYGESKKRLGGSYIEQASWRLLENRKPSHVSANFCQILSLNLLMKHECYQLHQNTIGFIA
jgi:hypothetical protein